MCCLEVILSAESYLILDTIHSEIVMIDIIPLLHPLLFTGIPDSLGYHHHFYGGSHHHDDDVESICCHEYWQ